MNKIELKKKLSFIYKIKYKLKSKGWIYIGKSTKIVNPKNLILGNGIQIAPYSLICPHGDSNIILGDNVYIGMFSRIACINKIVIGKNTLTGPNVFISDYNHCYSNVNIPISQQGNTSKNSKVIIGEDCWIGTNVVICGNLTIGKHVVIGACSFVNKDVPDYSVVVGNPAKVIKRYNFESNKWERV